MKDNFEKYFKDRFENFEVKPDSKLWNQINNSLFEKQTKSLFDKYFVQPSSNVWKKISFILWWKNFTRFSVTHFNIYYVLFILFSLGGFIYYNYYKKEVYILNSEHQNNLENNFYNYGNFKNLKSNYFDNFNSHNNNFIVATHINTNTANKKIKENDIYNYTYVGQINTDEGLNKIKIKNIEKLDFSSLPNDSFIKKDFLSNIQYSNYFVSFNIAPALTNSNLIIKPNENISEIDNYKLLNTNSYAISLFLGKQYYNFSFETGLMLYSLNQNFSYDKLSIFVDTILNLTIYDNSYYHYSYTQVLNLDSLLLTGDTIWITHVDSTLVVNIDTIWSSEIKEVKSYNETRASFSYKTIEIPFLVGYNQSLGRFEVGIKAGLSLAYVLTTKGYWPLKENNKLIEAKRETFNTFVINSLVALDVSYNVSERMAIHFMPTLRKNLVNISSNENILKFKSNSLILNIGLKYTLK